MTPGEVIIEANPSNVIMNNQNVTLNCSARGGIDNYQWQKNQANLPGEIQSTLQLISVDVDDGGEYTCFVGNIAGNNSGNFTLYVHPYIITDPETQLLVTEGDMANFFCEAFGFPQPTYQWIKVGDMSFNYSEQTLSFISTDFGDEGSYGCIASIRIGSIDYTIQSEPGELISKHSFNMCIISIIIMFLHYSLS